MNGDIRGAMEPPTNLRGSQHVISIGMSGKPLTAAPADNV